MLRDLQKLSDQSFDIVVIGGGVHGAWIAWDAALRGLAVALIERGDFGGETSANSLKTVHGGLRYLQDADIGLVRMMVQERSAYLRIAPHLVHPLPCLMPTYSNLMRSKPVMGVALRINDLFGFDRNQHTTSDKRLPGGRLLSRQDCLDVLPGVADAGISGGAIWHDGQIYDTERFTLSLVKSAAGEGAVVANYVEAIGFSSEGSRVTSVRARDIMTGDEFEVRCKLAINAAGPWVDRVLNGASLQAHERKFNHSLAMNIVVRKFIKDYAAGVPSYPFTGKNGNGKTSRMLFISPWRETSIVGTFHSHYSGDPDQFELREEQLVAILEEVNSAYPGADLELSDICFVHHGFLPKKSRSSDGEVDLIRAGLVFDHKIQDRLEGLITVVGVKFTSARRVAEQAVDLAFQHLGISTPACATRSTRLTDGRIEGYSDYLSRAAKDEEGLLAPALVEHLVRSYGSEYPQLRRRIPPSEQGEELTFDSPEVLQAMARYAVEEEMAIRLSDVILRRMALGSAGRPDPHHIRLSAEAMKEAAGWDQARTNEEIDAVDAVYTRLGL